MKYKIVLQMEIINNNIIITINVKYIKKNLLISQFLIILLSSFFIAMTPSIRGL